MISTPFRWSHSVQTPYMTISRPKYPLSSGPFVRFFLRILARSSPTRKFTSYSVAVIKSLVMQGSVGFPVTHPVAHFVFASLDSLHSSGSNSVHLPPSPLNCPRVLTTSIETLTRASRGFSSSPQRFYKSRRSSENSHCRKRELRRLSIVNDEDGSAMNSRDGDYGLIVDEQKLLMMIRSNVHTRFYLYSLADRNYRAIW